MVNNKWIICLLFFVQSTSLLYGQSINCNDFKNYTIKTKNLIGYDFEISILDLNNSKLSSFVVNNCNCSSYHFAEYNFPNLYIVKVNSKYENELWFYSNEINYKISDIGSVAFNVNSKQKLIAYIKRSNNLEFSIRDLLNNIDDTTIVLKEYNVPIEDCWIDLFKWSTDGNTVWGSINGIGIPAESFFSYNCKSKELTKYEIPENLGDDFDINPDSSLLVFSDYIYPIDAPENIDTYIIEEGLFVYNFNTRENKLLMKVQTQNELLRPKWICNDYIEIYSVKENKRISVEYK